LLFLCGQGRAYRLQRYCQAPQVHLGERQDNAAPHIGQLCEAPAPGDRGDQTLPSRCVAPVYYRVAGDCRLEAGQRTGAGAHRAFVFTECENSLEPLGPESFLAHTLRPVLQAGFRVQHRERTASRSRPRRTFVRRPSSWAAVSHTKAGRYCNGVPARHRHRT